MLGCNDVRGVDGYSGDDSTFYRGFQDDGWTSIVPHSIAMMMMMMMK